MTISFGNQRLVLETIRQVNGEDPDRKCFRMVGGILVERTVKDILPQLQTNQQGVRFEFHFFLSDLRPNRPVLTKFLFYRYRMLSSNLA